MDYKIAVLGGDGIGPEVIAQAIKVLNAIAEKFNHTFNYEYALIGAVAIDEVGNPFPEKTFQICKNADAVLFGCLGDPKYDNDPTAKVRPEHGLLAMRKELGLYCNLRPVKTFPSFLDKSPLKNHIVHGTDIMIVRELTGGIYFGRPQGRTEDGTTAYDTCIYSVNEIERISKFAYKLAKERKKKLTLVDKANVLATSRLWREVVQRLAQENQEVETSYMFVDNASMQLIQCPKQFDVIVTTNMFGDILTDEASVIAGSLGLLPSASVGLHTSVFEPVHGSYPQAVGKNIANPLGTILSTAMMLDIALDLKIEAKLIHKAVENSITENKVTVDLDKNSKLTTENVGNWLANYILS